MSSKSGTRLYQYLDLLRKELEHVRPTELWQQFAVDRLAQRCSKRAKLSKPGLRELAIAKFLEVNSEMGDITISPDPEYLRSARAFILKALEGFTSRIDPLGVQNTLNYDYLLSNWRFGPGTSNGTKSQHTARKICEDWTCTKLCESLVVELRGTHYAFQSFDARWGRTVQEVRGSRLATVAKNEDTERTIAIEPSGNMALQLAAGSYLEGALRYVGIDIRDQAEKNKRLARIGSLNQSLATIDFSQASDRISPELVKLLFPREWFELFWRIRSPSIKVPGCDEEVTLNMISTMGNGFTFPLMTLILASLAYAVMTKSEKREHCYLDTTVCGVFGDDVILPTGFVEDYILLTECSGFRVNKAKSFLAGPFRESCGGDYYEGNNVTPFYIKSLSHDPEVYAAINGLLEFCSRTYVFLPQTLAFLFSCLDGPILRVPFWDQPTAGLRTKHVPKRYTKFTVKQETSLYRGDPVFEMMLVCGGYVNPMGANLSFTERPKVVKYTKVRSRMPKGFLDGGIWCLPDASRASYVDDLVTMLMF